MNLPQMRTELLYICGGGHHETRFATANWYDPADRQVRAPYVLVQAIYLLHFILGGSDAQETP